MRFQSLDPDALYLSARWNAEKDYYEVFEHGTDRRLGFVRDLECNRAEGIDAEDLLLCRAAVNGCLDAPDPEGPVHPLLRYPDGTEDERGCANGADFPLVDLATGRRIYGVIDVALNAHTGKPYTLAFSFLAQDNALGPAPLPVEPCDRFRLEGGGLKIRHRDGAAVIGLPAEDIAAVFSN